MDYNEFERLLNIANLGKTEFAKINHLNKHSVFNWKQKEIPGWVQPWLENYIKAVSFDSIKEAIMKTEQL